MYARNDQCMHTSGTHSLVLAALKQEEETRKAAKLETAKAVQMMSEAQMLVAMECRSAIGSDLAVCRNQKLKAHYKLAKQRCFCCDTHCL